VEEGKRVWERGDEPATEGPVGHLANHVANLLEGVSRATKTLEIPRRIQRRSRATSSRWSCSSLVECRSRRGWR
jgi:hypothetical protein